MIKFINKKHMEDKGKGSKIIIYYNISDIFLGVVLLILVTFFINDYLLHASKDAYYNYPAPVDDVLLELE